MKADDLMKAVACAVRVTDLYDAVAEALREAGIDEPWRPWGEIADRIERKQPELAAVLRCAQARWSKMMEQR